MERQSDAKRQCPRCGLEDSRRQLIRPNGLFVVTNISVRPIRRWRALLAAAGRVFPDPEEIFPDETHSAQEIGNSYGIGNGWSLVVLAECSRARPRDDEGDTLDHGAALPALHEHRSEFARSRKGSKNGVRGLEQEESYGRI
jgi:hypothetical protein